VVIDINGDGTFDSEDMIGLPGLTVELRNMFNVLIDTDVTGSDGGFFFNDLSDGNYTITTTNAAGFLTSDDSDGGSDNTIAATVSGDGPNAGHDFMHRRPSCLPNLGPDPICADATCSNVFYDTGGLGGSYGDNEDFIQTICSANGDPVSVTFTAFETELGNDVLFVYDGFDTNASLIGAFSGNVGPGSVTASVECLTFRFTSDGANSIGLGWSAMIDCPPTTPPGHINGNVLVDIDGDGTLDAEDTNGLVGVNVVLYDSNSVAVATRVTDTNGYYEFRNLQPGDYVVESTNLASYVSTADAVPPNDDRIPITVISNTTHANNFFLDTQPAVVSGSVFEDINGNGLLDPEDTNGLAAAMVALVDSNGATVETVSPMADGSFQFMPAMPGAYTIQETDPAGFTSTADSDGGNSNSISIFIFSGMPNGNHLFLDVEFSTISGTVLNDLNSNGIFDPEDTNGLSGATVQLTDTNGMVLSTAMPADGNFQFANVLPGDYLVRETDPGGFSSSGDIDGGNFNEIAVSIQSGDAITGRNFLDFGPGDIRGQALTDVLGNGVVDVDDIVGLFGVGIQLQSTNGAVLMTTFTDFLGNFNFLGIAPGNYLLFSTNHPISFFPTGDTEGSNDNTIAVQLDSDEDDTGNVFLFAANGAIRGTIWVDENGNGTKDASENTGIPGGTITLVTTNGVFVDQLVPDGSGAFNFSDVAPGTYDLLHTNAPTYISTGDRGGGDPDVQQVIVRSGQFRNGRDFYDVQAANITGNVFEDFDGDGLLDPEDSNGLGLVDIILMTNGVPVDTNQTTAGTGAFSFVDIIPATYTLMASNLPGFFSTGDSDGPNDDQVVVTLMSGGASSNNVFLDSRPGSIAGSVFEDIDGDGNFDSEDTNGLAGVAVGLFDTNLNLVASNLTGAAGDYLFNNVTAGVYLVIATNLPGFFSTGDRDGGPGLSEIMVTIFSGDTSITNDFLDAAVGAVEGVVVEDINGNFGFDAEDTNPIVNATIVLSDTNGNPVATNITGVTGAWSFTNLPPGDYVIDHTPPAGFAVGEDTDAGADGQIAVSVMSRTTSTGHQFMALGLVAINGSVFEDIDGDGLFDPEDTNGVAGATVRLQIGAGNTPHATTKTDGNGFYQFTNLLPEIYRVIEDDPAGFVSTADRDGGDPSRIDLTLLSRDVSVSNDFLDARPATVNGSVYEDEDADGVFDLGFDQPLAGVTVTLTSTNGSFTQAMLTDASGNFSFSNVPPGDYFIMETNLPGFFSTGDSDGPNDDRIFAVLASGGSSGGHRFLDAQPGIISGLVLEDLNGNGMFDAGDNGGVMNADVFLVDSNGVTVQTTMTDAGGNYTFTNINPGLYMVHETNPPGFFSTGDVDGGDPDLLAVLKISSANNVSNNFLDTQPGSISGSVFVDVDGDGLFDPEDTGTLSGVEIVLLNASLTPVQTNLTDGAGAYVFSNILPRT
ncbi:MAG: SdrD B-like domain-containing protein, partial [Verrucomicrobiota bacterium]